jgi:hypothetical protein
MAVYNPPDQILFDPITNYHQGKALRADTALREKQAEALQAELDAAPAAAKAAARKAQREEEKHQIALTEEERKAQDHANEELGKRSAAAVLVRRATGSDEEATAAFFEGMPDEARQEIIKAYGDDVIRGDDLWARIEGHGITYGGLDGEGETSQMERMIDSLPYSDERKDELRAAYVQKQVSSPPRKQSINDIVVPILGKIAAGQEGELTEGEKAVLDIYKKQSFEDRLLAAMFPELIDPRDIANETPEESGDTQPSPDQAGTDRKTLALGDILNLVTNVNYSERNAWLETNIPEINEKYGLDLTVDEAKIFIDLHGTATIRDVIPRPGEARE